MPASLALSGQRNSLAPTRTIIDSVKALVDERAKLKLREEELARAKTAPAPNFSNVTQITYEQVTISKMMEDLLAEAQAALAEQKDLVKSIGEEVASYLSAAAINRIGSSSAHVLVKEGDSSFFAVFRIDKDYYALPGNSEGDFNAAILAQRRGAGPDFSLAGPFYK
jgi:hypothetical protein